MTGWKSPVADAKVVKLFCPRHSARFCLKTGKVLKGPAYEALPTLLVRVVNGTVQVKDERWA